MSLMEFCSKCGSIIIIKEGKAVCANCNFKAKKKPIIQATEKIKRQDKVAIIKENVNNPNPIVEIKCPKCKNKKAYFWVAQTRAADESETKFYKCVKCSHTWRVYK